MLIPFPTFDALQQAADRALRELGETHQTDRHSSHIEALRGYIHFLEGGAVRWQAVLPEGDQPLDGGGIFDDLARRQALPLAERDDRTPSPDESHTSPETLVQGSRAETGQTQVSGGAGVTQTQVSTVGSRAKGKGRN